MNAFDTRAEIPSSQRILWSIYTHIGEWSTWPRKAPKIADLLWIPKSDDDKANLIVSRALHLYSDGRCPYNPGHLLVLPYREVADIEDLNKDEQNCFLESTIKAKRLLTTAIKPDGFNIGVNLAKPEGLEFLHLHLHVVPRWNGDTNFMPVVGSTRVLPQSLEAMWDRLKSVRES